MGACRAWAIAAVTVTAAAATTGWLLRQRWLAQHNLHYGGELAELRIRVLLLEEVVMAVAQVKRDCAVATAACCHPQV